MRVPASWSVVLLATLSRSAVSGTLPKGESMTWDQIELIAQDTGISGNHLLQVKIKEQVAGLIRRYHLPLQMGGFVDGMADDEEFRVNKSSQPAVGSLEMNAAFWEKNPALADNEAYLTYLLFRAEAIFEYRSHYDPEHFTWVVQQQAAFWIPPSFSSLRTALNASAALNYSGETPPSERDLEFRRTLDPTQNPTRTFQKLIEYALRCVAEEASDQWAIETYQARIGTPPPSITARMTARERVLASDYGRARFAMTLPERVMFQRALVSPFRYTEMPPAAKEKL